LSNHYPPNGDVALELTPIWIFPLTKGTLGAQYFSQTNMESPLTTQPVAYLAAPPNQKGYRPVVLIIDDDREFCAEAAEFLDRNGYSCLIMERPNSRHFHMPFRPDFVVLDLNLPSIDGFEIIAKYLRSWAKTPALVVVSGMDEGILRAATAAALANRLPVLGALTKPIRPNRLMELLRMPQAAPGPALSRVKWSEAPIVLQRLQEGLERKTVHIDFQPIVRLTDGGFAGAEALVANEFEGLGYVSAETQIDALLTLGRLDEFTWVMTESALSACRSWARPGERLPVSINVRRRTLENPNLVERLLNLVERYELKPEDLVVELSEEDAFNSRDAVLGNLGRLRLHGFGVALDDFGVHHSNLGQLVRLPISEVKIDGSLIADIVGWNRSATIVGDIIATCRREGFSVVAEVVETEQQATLLRRLGCEKIQGRLVGPKMPIERLLSWSSTWTKVFPEDRGGRS